MDNYSQIISFVFRQEGGYTNDPRDPGGATNFGITIYDARKHWKPDATPADVRQMPKSVAEGIYKDKYWVVIHGSEIASGLDACTMDSAVNSGVGRANIWLGRAIGSPAKDYPTLAKQSRGLTEAQVDTSIDAYCDIRVSFLHSLRTWSAFGKGWGRRVAELRALSHVLLRKASGKPAEQISKELGGKVAEVRKNQSTASAKASGGILGQLAAYWQFWANDPLHWMLLAAGIGISVFLVWKVVQNMHQIDAYNKVIKDLDGLR